MSTAARTTKAETPGSTGPSADECVALAMDSTVSDAALRPYLRSIGCDEAADGLLVGAGDE